MFSEKFGRLITAMVTPFNHDLSIDFDSLEKLINHLIETGTESILVSGTTGENPTLTHDEEWILLRKTKEIINGRIPIIFGAGSNSTKTATESSLKAQEEGADGIMSVCPYYNKPNQEGIIAHFSAVAEAVDLPILIYNNPGRTGSYIEANAVSFLNKKFSNISAVKESSGSLDFFVNSKIENPNVEVYCGDDYLTLPSLSVGSVGVVSVASHFVGKDIRELIETFLTGKNSEAAKIHTKLFPLYKALFKSPSPGPTKYILSKLGVIKSYVRLPITQPAESVRNSLDEFVNEIALLQG
ncbi:MAG: 4-hydroxy-tetrahydrodipicolinate synthase [Candidatus Caenarcaniphilales bacterium]|nr:4-hydroxy-tetrahydrodipicolinate synthase [Candidatus Caenarcaniphilales bacterium]